MRVLLPLLPLLQLQASTPHDPTIHPRQAQAQGENPLGAGAAAAAGLPVAGWSTWNTFACSINATLVKQGADHLVSSGLLAAGNTYIVRALTPSATPELRRAAAALPHPYPPRPERLPVRCGAILRDCLCFVGKL